MYSIGKGYFGQTGESVLEDRSSLCEVTTGGLVKQVAILLACSLGMSLVLCVRLRVG